MHSSTLTKIGLEEILVQRKKLRRQLLACADLKDIRIAVLGGTTTNEVVDLLEILLLAHGFRPEFHQSEYGRYYEDAVLEPQEIAAFKPDLIYIHTCSKNIRTWPPIACTEAELGSYVDAELNRYRAIWDSLNK